MNSLIDLAQKLIARPSVTPQDAGCQEIIRQRLAALGFAITPLPFGEVHNLWARFGAAAPLFVFAGHTDVVPAGTLADWDNDPFTPTLHDGMLYGRGSADMKGSLAAMVTATEAFLQQCPQPKGSIAFLLTSDEEGPAINGTAKVIAWLQQQQQQIDWCVIGEPSSNHKVGDVIKHGRRGSLSAKLLIKGRQGHIAYPHLASNPVHLAAPLIQELCQHQWDQGNADFPPTSFQISNIHAGTGAGNMIPGTLEIQFNLRFSTMTDAPSLQAIIEQIIQRHVTDYKLEWTLFGKPFLTAPGKLRDAAIQAVEAVTGNKPELSTSGGTSDGRFIAPTGAQVIELGPLNATIHQINEHVRVQDLQILQLIYEEILQNLLG